MSDDQRPKRMTSEQCKMPDGMQVLYSVPEAEDPLADLVAEFQPARVAWNKVKEQHYKEISEQLYDKIEGVASRLTEPQRSQLRETYLAFRDRYVEMRVRHNQDTLEGYFLMVDAGQGATYPRSWRECFQAVLKKEFTGPTIVYQFRFAEENGARVNRSVCTVANIPQDATLEKRVA